MLVTAPKTLDEHRRTAEPIRVLELRCSDGAGGGPEKTILHGTCLLDPAKIATTICYVCDEGDLEFDTERKAQSLGLKFRTIRQRHAFDLRIYRQIRRVVQTEGIDIVHAHDYKTNLIALLLAQHTRIIPLSTAHGYTGDLWRERWLYYPVDRRLLAKFPRVIAVSTALRQQLIDSGVNPGRITVLLNGIDPQQYRRDESQVESSRAMFSIGPEDFVIGAVGRLAQQKRFDLLLESFSDLCHSHPHLRLIVAGDGPMRPQLLRRAEILKIADRCSLIGHATDVRSFYHALDCFVQSSEYEGTPNVVLEAMAMEVPVVATAAGGTAELLNRDCGWLTPVGDVPAISCAIKEVITNQVERRRRTARARRRVEDDLSFQVRTQKLERVYNELVESKATSSLALPVT